VFKCATARKHSALNLGFDSILMYVDTSGVHAL